MQTEHLIDWFSRRLTLSWQSRYHIETILLICSAWHDIYDKGLRHESVNFGVDNFCDINPLGANPKKWSNTPKQSVGNRQPIVCVFLTILWSWLLKG